ncbi:hypothetical protein PWT90_05921 [Aphanocladium album]|nr:hypothetical protein PWT90_05921 [Aphanocladium album]
MNIYAVFILLLGTAQSLTIPHPRGPYSVAYKVHDLTDVSRLDPSAPEGSQALRRILLSVFLPLDTSQVQCVLETIPYLPPETARVYNELAPSLGLPMDMLGSFEIDYCTLSGHRASGDSKRRTAFPVAIFSPGHTVSRLLYTSLARNLASCGYVVITVDHPYDAEIVEFPDGTVIRGNSDTSTDSLTLDDLKVRTGDISFIINQLQTENTTNHIIEGFPHAIDSTKIAVFGHSLGGAAAAALMLENTHIKGGLDFDGEIYGPVVNKGLAAPFVLVSSMVNNGTAGLENWGPFWDHLRDTKLQFSIFNTTHLSFLDIPLLLTVFPLPDTLKPMVEAVFGTIDGDLMELTINGILTAYFDLLFRSCVKPLCGLARRFADISVDKSSLSQSSCS